jgi:broad specificity phosphatase PhoE
MPRPNFRDAVFQNESIIMKQLIFLSLIFLCVANVVEGTEFSETSEYITIIKAWRHGETYANKKNLISGGTFDDSLGLTLLTDEGKKQAAELGKKVLESGDLDVIYTSDLSRALETAGGVVKAFKENGKNLDLRLSKQLREVLHGKFEFTDAIARSEASNIRFYEMLELDAQQITDEEELNDKYRFWKIYPIVSNDEVVPEDIVDVDDYIQREETRPETPFKLWQRAHQEFIKIAQENPGATVGISTHGACLATLIDGLNKNPRGAYLPPHYHSKVIKVGDKVVLPAATKVENCALVIFKYDSRNGGKLELLEQ